MSVVDWLISAGDELNRHEQREDEERKEEAQPVSEQRQQKPAQFGAPDVAGVISNIVQTDGSEPPQTPPPAQAAALGSNAASDVHAEQDCTTATPDERWYTPASVVFKSATSTTNPDTPAPAFTTTEETIGSTPAAEPDAPATPSRALLYEYLGEEEVLDIELEELLEVTQPTRASKHVANGASAASATTDAKEDTTTVGHLANA